MKRSKFYLIAPNYAESGTLETLPETDGLQILKNDDLVQSKLHFSTNDLVCITSEASIELVKQRIDDENKKNAISVLKDKYRFREILTEIIPDYNFRKLKFEEIASLDIQAKSVLKPSKGCFGTAVKTVSKESNFVQIAKDIKQELDKNSSVLSSEVLSENEFILEDYIDGEEYAVDMFYDHLGEPHIVNIYHHPMPKIEAYLHMIYYTSKSVFDSIYAKAMNFFRELNAILKVKNFTMHSEFRFSENKLLPIEINSMRFGGMGLGNMVYHSIGINPYVCFKTGKTPDWNKIWKEGINSKSIYAFFIAYNGRHINKNLYRPNIEKLKREFTEVLHHELFDYQKQLAFGVFYLKENWANLNKLLTIEFNDYFEQIGISH